MKTSNDYIDAAKIVRGSQSDRAFAVELGWSQGAITHYRNKRAFLSNEHASQLAEILGRNPLELIAAAELERAKDESKKAYWARFAKRYAGLAASVVFAVMLLRADPYPISLIHNENGWKPLILCQLTFGVAVRGLR